MSRPRMLIFVLYLSTAAASHRCVHTISEVDRPLRNPACDDDKKLSTFIRILSRTASDKILRSSDKRTIGRKCDFGPACLPGFCTAIRNPPPMFSGSWRLNDVLITSATNTAPSFPAAFSSSAEI